MANIKENLEKVIAKLPDGVRLVAVSKFHPVEELAEAYKAGQRLFGENSIDAEGNPTALEKVIVISDDAIYGSDREKLFYKLVLLDAMHGKVGQDAIDSAASDLGITEYWLTIYTRP